VATVEQQTQEVIDGMFVDPPATAAAPEASPEAGRVLSAIERRILSEGFRIPPEPR
jgi:hypothetical protein